jgi:hypothetical protein
MLSFRPFALHFKLLFVNTGSLPARGEVRGSEGHAIAQAVNHQLPTAVAQVQPQVR